MNKFMHFFVGFAGGSILIDMLVRWNHVFGCIFIGMLLGFMFCYSKGLENKIDKLEDDLLGVDEA